MTHYMETLGKCTIPEEKKAELKDRMQKLLFVGGMLDFERVELLGYKFDILMPPTYCSFKSNRFANEESEQILVGYNYFEEGCWDFVGYDATKAEMIRHEVGGGLFAKIIYAAYVLLELYSNSFVITACDGEIHYKGETIGWLNYLFGEKFNHDRTSDLQRIRDLLPEELRDMDMSEVYCEPSAEMKLVCTSVYLQTKEEDHLYYWRPEGDVFISDQTKAWFAELRAEYDEILQCEGLVIDSANYIREFLSTLDRLNSDYRRIYFFKSTFEEFLSNGSDRRYQAALILLQRLADRYADEIDRLQSAYWHFEWKTPGRLTIKRYVALLANGELRRMVLEF